MSEEANVDDSVNNNEDTPNPELTALQEENASMRAKMDELLGETKRAKTAAKEAAKLAEQEKLEKAQKAGDYEQLHKSSEQARQALEEELNGLRGSIANEKRDNAAMKIASELADGANAEILSEFIARRLKHTDDGLKVLDGAGQLTVSTVEDLAQDFKSNSRFASLLKGNQASGGEATGGGKEGVTSKTMSRADFDKLSPMKRMEFVKGGGKTLD
jgi:hypothetical protein